MGIQAISPFDTVPKDILTIIVTLVGDPSITSRISKRFNEIEWETVFYRDYENTPLKKKFDKTREQYPHGSKRQIVRLVYEKIIKKVHFLPNAQELFHQSEFRMGQAENSFTAAGNCKLSAWRLIYLDRQRKEKAWESSTNAFNALSGFLDRPTAAETRIWLKAQGVTNIYEQNRYLIRSWLKVNEGDRSSYTSFAIEKKEICFLPKWLGYFDQLQSLTVTNCFLRQIPDQIGNLGNLCEVCLSHNQITVLPESFFRLKKLKMLQLDNNNIKKLPKEIEGLISLEILSLSNNQIEELPEELGSLRNLSTLILGDNQLKELPERMGGLENLEMLSLARNPLTEFPKQLLKLKKLNSFRFDENLTKIFLQDEDFKRWRFVPPPTSTLRMGIFSKVWSTVVRIFSALFYSVRSWGTRCFAR